MQKDVLNLVDGNWVRNRFKNCKSNKILITPWKIHRPQKIFLNFSSSLKYQFEWDRWTIFWRRNSNSFILIKWSYVASKTIDSSKSRDLAHSTLFISCIFSNDALTSRVTTKMIQGSVVSLQKVERWYGLLLNHHYYFLWG